MEENLENSKSRIQLRLNIGLSILGISTIYFTLRLWYRASIPIELSGDIPSLLYFVAIIGAFIWIFAPASFIISCVPSKSFQLKFIRITIEAILFVLTIAVFIGSAIWFLKDFPLYYYNTINDEPNSILCLDAAVVLWTFILCPTTILCNQLEFIYHLIRGTESGLAKYTGTLNPGHAAQKRELYKRTLYSHLEASFYFVLLCIGELMYNVTGEKRSTSFLIQRISVAVQKGNAAAILNTVPSEASLDEIYYL